MPEGTDEMQSSVVTIRRNARSRRLLPIDHFHFLISLPRLVSLLSSPAPAATMLAQSFLFFGESFFATIVRWFCGLALPAEIHCFTRCHVFVCSCICVRHNSL